MQISTPSHAADHKLRGRLLVLAAAVMWSTGGFFAKAPVFASWDESVRGSLLAFWRALFAGLVLVPFVRQPRWNWKMLPMSATFVAMNITYLSALVLTTAANAVWLQYTAPVWVFVIGAFVLREKVTRSDWRLLAVAGIGVAIILLGEARGNSLPGVGLGLLSGLLFAGILLWLRVLRAYDSAWLVALNHIITALVLAPWVVAVNVWPSGVQWVYVIGFGMLQMGLPYLLFARGLRDIAGHEASAITLLEPLLVPVWVWLAWHGHPDYVAPSWWTFVGGGFILAGLLGRYGRLFIW